MASKISILIITYNRPGDLLDLLKSINSQSGKEDILEEVLVLNNASTESIMKLPVILARTQGLKQNLYYQTLILALQAEGIS